jgi:hypothetical protein
MTEVDRLTPADPQDLADALAFALRFDGRRRKHDAAEMMARIVAKRPVKHLERLGFVVMKETANRRRSGAWARIRGAIMQPPKRVVPPGWGRNELTKADRRESRPRHGNAEDAGIRGAARGTPRPCVRHDDFEARAGL